MFFGLKKIFLSHTECRGVACNASTISYCEMPAYAEMTKRAKNIFVISSVSEKSLCFVFEIPHFVRNELCSGARVKG